MAETGKKLERKYLLHYVDAAFSADSPNYVRLGKDLEDFSEELNPDVEITKNIWGEQNVNHNGYEVQSDVGTYYAYENEPLFEQLAKIANERATGDDCKTTKVDVLVDSSGTVLWAYREEVWLVPNSVGGDTSGVQIPFTIYNSGSRTAGSWNADSATFTETTAVA